MKLNVCIIVIQHSSESKCSQKRLISTYHDRNSALCEQVKVSKEIKCCRDGDLALSAIRLIRTAASRARLTALVYFPLSTCRRSAPRWPSRSPGRYVDASCDCCSRGESFDAKAITFVRDNPKEVLRCTYAGLWHACVVRIFESHHARCGSGAWILTGTRLVFNVICWILQAFSSLISYADVDCTGFFLHRAKHTRKFTIFALNQTAYAQVNTTKLSQDNAHKIGVALLMDY